MSESPIMNVGKYVGVSVDKLPNSYLRWMITQSFPKEILDAALQKLEHSDYEDTHLLVSRHAIDRFSKRFLHLWIKSEGAKGDEADGIATFIVKQAERAWEEGLDVSKHRHQDDGVIKELDGVKYVFNVSQEFPEYKDLITVMKD
jgi:uncharacterized protein (DUF3820 family)